jgi:hypothetical protein
MMKKWFVGIMVAALIVTCSVSIYAAPGKFHEGPGKFRNAPEHQIRGDAGYIIHRTATVFFDTQRAVEHGHRNFGYARAIAYQQKARELYLAGAYQDAIFFSLRARDLAFQVIEGNRERPRREFYRDEMEERYRHDSPRDEELELRIDHRKVVRDDDVVRLHFDFDIK